MTVRRLLVGLLASGLLEPALAASLPSPDQAPLQRTVAGAPATVKDGTPPSRLLVPRSDRFMWKPFPGTLAVDTGEAGLAGKTVTAALEVPDDFVAARIWFANQGTRPYTISGCLVSGSSQWAPPASTGKTPGITPYDVNGDALTTMVPCSFRSAGADPAGEPPGPVAPPAGINVPASTNPPIASLAWSDWMPVASIARIDGPVARGNILVGTGIPADDSVSSIAPTEVILARPLPSGYPANTALQACQRLTTTAATLPNSELSFASTAGLTDAMLAYVGGAPFASGSGGNSFVSGNRVARVGARTITLAEPLPPNFGYDSNVWRHGTPVEFDVPMVAAEPTAAGNNRVTVRSTAGLSSGMTLYTTGLRGTITVADGTHFTVASTATGAGIALDQPLHLVLKMSTDVDATAGTQLVLSSTAGTPMILAGDRIVGTNIPGGALAWGIGDSNGTSINLDRSVTGPGVAAGATVRTCKTMKTAAATPAGSSTLTFGRTTYPNKLFLVRLRYSGSPTNGNFWAKSHSASAAWNALGLPAFEGAACAADGITSVSAIGSHAGGCGRVAWFPEYAVEFLSPHRVLTVLVSSDSHGAGDTTVEGSANFVARGLAPLSTPDRPISVVNAAWGGQPSAVYAPTAVQIIDRIKPDIAVIFASTWNDPFSAPAQARMSSTVTGMVRTVQGFGGLPVIVGDYQRQVFGCNTADAAGETDRRAALALERAPAADGLPVLDLGAIMADPVDGPSFMDRTKSNDCIHANDNGHQAMGDALRTLLRPHLAN